MESQSNLAWDTLLDLGPRSSGPLHARLTGAIRGAIRGGLLPNGVALPPSRKLAEDLAISRWVVIQAYEQLVAEGYLDARVGSATRVRWSETTNQIVGAPPLPAVVGPRLDLGPGLPDLRVFPRRAWVEAIRVEANTAPYIELAYPPPGGHPRLRSVLAEYLRRVRGAVVRDDDVTITTGVVDGMTQMFRALVDGGARAVAVEDPGWQRIRAAAGRAGLRVVPIPMDDRGMQVEHLAWRTGIGAVIVTPAHQFPTGSVLAPDRRTWLLDWARRADAVVLEDDYDAEYRYDRRPIGTVQGIDPSQVALLGSLSKTLAPAISIGWIVTPTRWTRRIRAAETRMTGPPVLEQLALSRFIRSGSYDRHLRSARRLYRKRRDRLVAALVRELPHCRISGVSAGLHLLLHLPRGMVASPIVAAAARRGVRVMDLRVCRVEPTSLEGTEAAAEALVLGYGNLDDGAVDDAVRELSQAVREANR